MGIATVGIDLGGTKLLAVRLDGDTVVEERHTSNPSGRVAVADALTTVVGDMLTDDVDAIGVGIAGLVQWPDGIFVWGPHVAGMGVHLRSHLEAAFGLPVVVDNDANVAAYAEHARGSARGYDHVVLVTLGTGIGGALITGGELYRGTSFAGEWGHTLFERNGERCACGKRGCWETAASAPALERLAADFVARNPEGTLSVRLAGAAITGQAVTRAADEGDETARGLVAQVGTDLGLGLCSLIAMLDPQIVVVGGGLGSVGESLLGPARRVAADALHGGSYRMLPPIVVADHGPSAGAVGAAMMAADLVTGRLELEAAT